MLLRDIGLSVSEDVSPSSLCEPEERFVSNSTISVLDLVLVAFLNLRFFMIALQVLKRQPLLLTISSLTIAQVHLRHQQQHRQSSHRRYLGPHYISTNLLARCKPIQPVDGDPVGRVHRRVTIDSRTHFLRLLVLVSNNYCSDGCNGGGDEDEEEVESDVESVDRAHFHNDCDKADELETQSDGGEDQENEREYVGQGVDCSNDSGSRGCEYDNTSRDKGELERDQIGSGFDEGVGETAEFYPTTSSRGVSSSRLFHSGTALSVLVDCAA